MPSKHKKKFSLWKVLYLLAVLLFFYLVYSRREEIWLIIRSVDRFDWKFLVLALFLQMMILGFQTLVYRNIYQMFGLRVRFERMVKVLLKANFASVVAPSGGFVVGMGVILQDGFSLGLSKGKLLIANIVYWVVYYLVFIFFLLISLFYMTLKNQINDMILIPAIILLLLMMIFLIIVSRVMDNFESFKIFSLKVTKLLNRIYQKIGKHRLFKEKSVKKYTYEVYEGYCFVVRNWYRFDVAGLFVILMIVGNVGILACLTAALGGAWTSMGVLLSCYMIAGLLMVISITPSGLGVVELMMTTILTTFLLPLEAAVLVVIFYRLFQFWLPVFTGFVVFRAEKNS